MRRAGRWHSSQIRTLLGCIAVFILASHSEAVSADGTELRQAFDDIFTARLDASTTRTITDFEITHTDLVIELDSGRIAFLNPVVIDSVEHRVGAYFEGRGRFLFDPPVDMEKEQLRRHFKSDSLDRSFKRIFLSFDDSVYGQLCAAGVEAEEPFGRKQIKRAKDRLENLTKRETFSYVWKTLQHIVEPAEDPFLLVNVDPEKTTRAFYMFDPSSREEVSMTKASHFFTEFKMPEVLCSYSQYLDESLVGLNGSDKTCLQAVDYDIDAEIDYGGRLTAATRARLVGRMPTQFARMRLHPELELDSIVDVNGQAVEFIRYTNDRYKSYSLYVLLDQPLASGDSLDLTFYYNGPVAERHMGMFFVNAGSYWYPRCGYGLRATFDIRFKTPKSLEFVATGTLVDEHKIKDTLFTHRQITEPHCNVSFSIGRLSHKEYKDDMAGTVDVYFNKDVHGGSDRSDQVADDVTNSLRLFTHYFGPTGRRKVAVSEVLQLHSEAFPGFVHLSFFNLTEAGKDENNEQRATRAHEIAHQWWGVDVDHRTYHDQWLSEGFAEYSSLLYVQAAFGNDVFLDFLKDYRNDIFSVRSYLLAEGEECGPVAMGYRTSTSKTPGDIDLVIYKKGAFILHMLRNWMVDLQSWSDDAFFAMMKDYYQTYRGRTATTADFQQIVEKHVGAEMDWFFDQWVYKNDHPEYTFSYSCSPDDEGVYTAACTVSTAGVDSAFFMYVPVEIELDKDRKAYIRVAVEGPSTEFTIPGLSKKPKRIRFNPLESVLAKTKQ